ncbi:MAG: hypothetical protein KDB14_32785 [Planctomycetales bacterium]|nr:hypothetical protein [Planctomycetales bacterium]
MSTMSRWIEYRSGQGRHVTMAQSPATSSELKSVVKREAAAHPRLRWVVLVGDAGSGEFQTPTHIVEAKVNVHFGSEPEIATDNPTADLDGDGVPDVAIGRLPADSPEDLSRMIEKIIRYERPTLGAWKRQVNFVAGVGGFGFVDAIIETVTKRFLTDGIPPEFCTTMTYGSWKSVYCPSPPSFHAATVERLNEGSLFWVYIGHGHRYQLDRIRVPGAHHHILDIRDMDKLAARNGASIAIMLACYTGAFDSPRDCIAEEMVRAEGGPVAALAGSRVTMPYAMSVLGNGLLEEYFVNKRETLGELFLHAKRGLAADADSAGAGPLAKNRQLLDMLARAVSPKPELVAAERMEHISLFNLIGDPLLQVRQPNALRLAAPPEHRAGDKLTLSGECDSPGQLRVELVCARDQQRFKSPSRGPYVESKLAMREFDRTYVLANDCQWTFGEQQHKGGKFELNLDVPRECRGQCFLRVFVDGERHAMGATPIFIKAAPRPVTASLAD